MHLAKIETFVLGSLGVLLGAAITIAKCSFTKLSMLVIEAWCYDVLFRPLANRHEPDGGYNSLINSIVEQAKCLMP